MLKQKVKRWRDTSPYMEPVCRALRRSVPLPERVWRHLPFTGISDFEVAGRLVRMSHFGAEIENSLFWAGYGQGWEATTLLLWERLAQTAHVVFDVGANTGVFALAAKAANPLAVVHAFEPMPRIAERLQANVALNGFAVAVHRVAVSDRRGTAQIQSMASDHEYSATLDYMAWMDHVPSSSIEVPVERLDAVIEQSGDRPDLIKIDVERHEPPVLTGLWPAVEGGPLPVLVIEILDQQIADLVEAQVAPRGYVSFAVREHAGVARKPLQVEDGVRNWLLVPAEAIGIAGELAKAGNMTHAQLQASRPAASEVAR